MTRKKTEKTYCRYQECPDLLCRKHIRTTTSKRAELVSCSWCSLYQNWIESDPKKKAETNAEKDR